MSVVADKGRIEVCNVSGKIVFKDELRFSEGVNYFSLPVELASGVYSARILWEGFAVSEKFVVR